jgi:O-antigen ligase
VKHTAWLLSLVLIFVIPLENTVMIGSIGTLSRMIGMLVAAVWLLAVVVEGELRRPGLFHGLVMLFFAWSAISIFWSLDPPETVEMVTTYLQLLVFVYLLWDLYSTPMKIRAGLQAYVLGAHVAIMNILGNMLTGRTGSYSRYTVEGFNADTAGLMLAIAMPMAWGLAMLQTREHRGGLLRWLNLAYIPLAFLGIALTATRTALIGTIPAILFAVASIGRLSPLRRLIVASFVVAGVLAIVPLIPQTSVERFLTTGTEISSGSLSGRGHIWKMGLQTFAQHPVLGVGAGAFRAAVGIGKVAHNVFISVLVELGIVGLALFLGILGVAFANALKHPPWGTRFWVTLLLIWTIAASSLTWERRKLTWLVLTLTAASAAVQPGPRREDEMLEEEPDLF